MIASKLGYWYYTYVRRGAKPQGPQQPDEVAWGFPPDTQSFPETWVLERANTLSDRKTANVTKEFRNHSLDKLGLALDWLWRIEKMQQVRVSCTREKKRSIIDEWDLF